MKINKIIYSSLMLLYAVTALGQNNSNTCPSELHVTPGISTVIDCALGLEDELYQWTSKDPSWLVYLNDISVGSPSIYIPIEDVPLNQIRYERRVYNAEGLLKQEGVLIIISTSSAVSEKSRNSGVLVSNKLFDLDEVSDTKIETPYLRCTPKLTVHSGEMIEISCIGGHSSEELLEYTVRFDWPPYTESKLIASGSFDYFIRAPEIDEIADVYMLEIFVKVPGTKNETVSLTEIHVINDVPSVSCNDITVSEFTEIDLPCTVPDQSVQIQLLSKPDLVQKRIYSEWPRLSIPEVIEDTSYPVIVRIFVNNKVAETSFNVNVLNSGPEEFGLECDPLMTEIYEGEQEFIEIMCKTIDAPTDELSWTWAAEGDTPLELLDVSGSLGTAEFIVPANVEEDRLYTYSVTATHADAGDVRVLIQISILEKPDITVTCEDETVRTGDSSKRLMCEASNDKNLSLNYIWSWTPIDLLSDVNTGTPLFETPVDQIELVKEYVYEVTVSAEFADPPVAPTELIVTVLKNLGPVEMTCNSPIEIYEGTPAFPLPCSVSSPVVTDLMWNWNPQDDLLIHGANGDPPVFQTPVSVDQPTTWDYLIQAHDPPHYEESVPQEVQITVLPIPKLTLNCPDNVEVFVGEAPRELVCQVNNDQNTDLIYTWEWTPVTRLSDATISNPVFDVPSQQREAELTYSYTVTVQAEFIDPVEKIVNVVVKNPEMLPSEALSVIMSELNFGTVRPQEEIRFDPSTEQISGEVLEGIPNIGRMILQAEDSVAVYLEQLKSVRLVHADTNESLMFIPEWSYSESCDQFRSIIQSSDLVRFQLEPGDCHVLRIGGSIALKGVIPGIYSGYALINMRVNAVEELYTIPVSVNVGKDYKAIVLGPSGADIVPVQTDKIYGDERLHIWPSVLEFGPEKRITLFDVYNPSLSLMEVHVAIPDTSDPVMAIYPRFALLNSGENMQIRLKLIEKLDDQEYPDMIIVTVMPRSYYDQDQRPDRPSPAKITFQVPIRHTK